MCFNCLFSVCVCYYLYIYYVDCYFGATSSDTLHFSQTIIICLQLTKKYVKFKLLSLNVRGIRSPEKRKGLFIWLNKQKADIIYLQETYSSEEIENTWRTQWNGKMFFAHGTNHSCGVMILVRNDLEFEEDS